MNLIHEISGWLGSLFLSGDNTVDGLIVIGVMYGVAYWVWKRGEA